MWVVVRGSVVRMCDPGSRVEVALCLTAPGQHVTSQRYLES
jgi:hypothetical protein